MTNITEYKQYGESLDVTLTPDEGYSNMKVQIKKEGSNKDFTSDYFNPNNNKIQIDSLHENITIDAEAFNTEGVTIYNVIKNLLGCYTSNSDIKIQEGSEFIMTVNPLDESYELKSVLILMGLFDITSQVWNESTKTINIPSVTGDLDININYDSDSIFNVQEWPTISTTNQTTMSDVLGYDLLSILTSIENPLQYNDLNIQNKRYAYVLKNTVQSHIFIPPRIHSGTYDTSTNQYYGVYSTDTSALFYYFYGDSPQLLNCKGEYSSGDTVNFSSEELNSKIQFVLVTSTSAPEICCSVIPYGVKLFYTGNTHNVITQYAPGNPSIDFEYLFSDATKLSCIGPKRYIPNYSSTNYQNTSCKFTFRSNNKLTFIGFGFFSECGISDVYLNYGDNLKIKARNFGSLVNQRYLELGVDVSYIETSAIINGDGNFTIVQKVNVLEGVTIIRGSLIYSPPGVTLTSFKSVTLPSTFEKIRNGSLFSGNICDLRQIIFKNSIPPTGNVFSGSDDLPAIVNRELKIYVPYSEDGSVLDAYKNSLAFFYTPNARDCIISLNPDGSIPSI